MLSCLNACKFCEMLDINAVYLACSAAYAYSASSSSPLRGFAVEVGRRTKKIRLHRRLHQRELASRANLGQDLLSKY
jgi:hypothetical protein